MKIALNNIMSVILTTFIYLLGGVDVALQCLLIMIILDYISGIASAIYNKNLDSKIGLKGILKKFMYLVIVCVSVIIDKIVGNTGAVRTLVIYFFVANDGLSIIENMGKMGIPLPKKLIDTLNQLKNKGDE
jgi:toxin secretion/phage lysis holin